MAQAGCFKPGSATDRVLQFVKAEAGAHDVVSRQAIARATRVPPKELGRALDVLCRNGQVVEADCGFAFGGEARPREPAAEQTTLESLGEPRWRMLAEIVRRAHQYRRAGAPSLAVSLLEQAAECRLPEHVRADLGHLADLFACRAGLYPTLDLGGRVA